MATLPAADRNSLWAEFMCELSVRGVEIPIGKAALRTFIDVVDVELEAAEINIINALPPGQGRNWVSTNPKVGRMMMALIEKRRAEVL